MVRPLLVLVLLSAVALPASASARARGASVALAECTTSAEQIERAAVFEGRMRATRLGQRLQMRFVLQTRRFGERTWVTVEVPGWGAWVTADPGVARYVYEKRLESLVAPAVYRAAVRFRWTSALGRVVRVARATSPACRQPDMRPNLEVGVIEIRGGRYLVPVLNAGRTTSEGFDVTLGIDGLERGRAAVSPLAAGARTVVAIDAGACLPGGTVTAAADPQGGVEERDETDNVASARCPGAAL